jgi:cardiolipin synthase
VNLPNLITVIRLLLIPLFVIFLLENRMDLALLAFVAASISDALDGFLARILKQKTLFGAYVDPLADKLLLATAFVTLAAMRQLPGWLAVVVVSRDVIILGGITILLLNNRSMTIQPTLDSKITTFFQLLTICFFLGQKHIADYWFLNIYIVGITALLTLFSGLHYVIIGFKILGRADEHPAADKGPKNHTS